MNNYIMDDNPFYCENVGGELYIREKIEENKDSVGEEKIIKGIMKKKKNFAPKRKAEFSIQFYFNKGKGPLYMMLTSQGGDLSNHKLDFYHFGVEMAKNDLLSDKEKDTFRNFCLGYIDEHDKIRKLVWQENRVYKKGGGI